MPRTPSSTRCTRSSSSDPRFARPAHSRRRTRLQCRTPRTLKPATVTRTSGSIPWVRNEERWQSRDTRIAAAQHPCRTSTQNVVHPSEAHTTDVHECQGVHATDRRVGREPRGGNGTTRLLAERTARHGGTNRSRTERPAGGWPIIVSCNRGADRPLTRLSDCLGFPPFRGGLRIAD